MILSTCLKLRRSHLEVNELFFFFFKWQSFAVHFPGDGHMGHEETMGAFSCAQSPHPKQLALVSLEVTVVFLLNQMVKDTCHDIAETTGHTTTEVGETLKANV